MADDENPDNETPRGGPAERFAALFDGLRRAYGVSQPRKGRSQNGKVPSTNRTETGELGIELYAKHLRGEQSLGVVPINDDDEVVFGAIDIDEYDGLDHAALAAKLATADLPLHVCRSKSGGAHLYVFFAEPQPAQDVRDLLAQVTVWLGQPGVEIFPKQGALAGDRDVGNWINLPYFGGDETTRHAVTKDGDAVNLETFLGAAEAGRATSLDQLEVETPTAFSDGPPCLQQLASTGVPAGARNTGLLAYGVYAQRKYGDDWEEMLEEYNRRHLDPPLSAEEVLAVIKSLRRKSYSYPCSQPPIVNVCNRELCLSRKFGVQPGSDENASVQIDEIQMLDVDPPIWFIAVNGKRLEMSSQELWDHNKFRLKCMERLRLIPAKMKADNWTAILNQKLMNMDEHAVIKAPPDASPTGQLLEYLHEWLTAHPMGDTRADLLLGKPFDDGHHVYFRSGDFHDFLTRKRFTALSKREIWSALRDHRQIQHKQLNVNGQCVQTWRLETKLLEKPADPEATEVAEQEEY